MDFKKKLRNFFTLTRKADAGFTLVELVIVIAILAILSAVAVPAYNGYIAKAKEAADQMIIAAANDAFAAACMENKVDVIDISEASVSVLEGKVYGLSSATYDSDATFVDKVAPYFLTYYAENEDRSFKTPNVNSLVWNDTLETFEMNAEFVATRVVLSSGKTISISAEDTAKIQNSTYADMGYSGVKEVIENVGESGEMLSGLCALGTIPSTSGNIFNLQVTGYTGLLPKLTDAMKAFGLIDDAKATEINRNLCSADDIISGGYRASTEEKNQSTQEAANGLTMITAKYLASGGNAEDLLAVDLGDSSAGVIEPMATGTGGTKTVSAIALQYALASSFANSDASNDVTIDGKTVAEYLASAEDPVAAIDTVKNLDAYQNSYVSSDPTSQYQKDINGFVGTMSILGDNLGTITAPGNIDLNDFLSNGINSSDAEDVLTSVLGE